MGGGRPGVGQGFLWLESERFPLLLSLRTGALYRGYFISIAAIAAAFHAYWICAGKLPHGGHFFYR
jgi:hypothetical protein